MGPNNSENPSGGVATLEPPQASSIVSPDGGNGLIPTPGASAPEANTMPSMGGTQSAPEAVTPPAMPDLGTQTPPSTETTATLNPMAPLGTPDVAALQATHNTMVAEKAAAQAMPPKPGLGNRLLGFIGLRGGVKTEVVGQSANSMPDHLKDGVTPPVPNVTPEAAAAVNQEPVMPSVPEVAAPTADPLTASATAETPSSTPEEASAPTPEIPAPALEPETPDVIPAAESSAPSATVDTSSSATPETPSMDAASAIAEADSIVKDAAGTNAALDEIDKTANTSMDTASSEGKPEDTTSATVDSSAGAFPSYGVRTEADATSPSTTNETPSVTQEAAVPAATASTTEPSAWPASTSTEPTTSGPSAVVEPTATPAVPEYQPTTDMTPAGEAAAPTAPASWSVDASATHPDAPVVGSVPSAPEAPSAFASSDPNALGLETTPTPLAGTQVSTEAPFGTGMPPSLGGASTESTTGITATPEEQPDTMTPTAPVPEPDASATTPLSTDSVISSLEAPQSAGTPPPPAFESPSGNVDASGLSTGVAEVPGSGAMGQPLHEAVSAPEPLTAASSFPSMSETPAAASPAPESPTPTDPLAASPTTTTS